MEYAHRQISVSVLCDLKIPRADGACEVCRVGRCGIQNTSYNYLIVFHSKGEANKLLLFLLNNLRAHNSGFEGNRSFYKSNLIVFLCISTSRGNTRLLISFFKRKNFYYHYTISLHEITLTEQYQLT
jgi:hypothetical protein